jgi:hypothetical protein
VIPRYTRRNWLNLIVAAGAITTMLCMVQSGQAQKFPSCVDNEAKEKTTRLLAKWYQDEGGGNSPGIKLLAAQIEGIKPRNARFGPYSGVLECEVAFSLLVLKVSTGEKFVIRPPDPTAIYYGYDHNGTLTLKMPGYTEAFQ